MIFIDLIENDKKNCDWLIAIDWTILLLMIDLFSLIDWLNKLIDVDMMIDLCTVQPYAWLLTGWHVGC